MVDATKRQALAKGEREGGLLNWFKLAPGKHLVIKFTLKKHLILVAVLSFPPVTKSQVNPRCSGE